MLWDLRFEFEFPPRSTSLSLQALRLPLPPTTPAHEANVEQISSLAVGDWAPLRSQPRSQHRPAGHACGRASLSLLQQKGLDSHEAKNAIRELFYFASRLRREEVPCVGRARS